jgi:PAS domain S-box-containing protein
VGDWLWAIRSKIEALLSPEPGGAPAVAVLKPLESVENPLVELTVRGSRLQHTQEKVRMSCQRYQDLHDFAPAAYFTFDRRGLVLAANLAGEDLLGSDEPPLIGRSFARFVDPRYTSVFQGHLRTVARSRRREHCRLVLNGSATLLHLQSVAVQSPEGSLSIRTLMADITEVGASVQELEAQIRELREKLARTRALSGLMYMCPDCKKIRDTRGYWRILERYIQEHSEAVFTHVFCPDCLKRLYPDP